jgi:hypothetical protein
VTDEKAKKSILNFKVKKEIIFQVFSFALKYILFLALKRIFEKWFEGGYVSICRRIFLYIA